VVGTLSTGGDRVAIAAVSIVVLVMLVSVPVGLATPASATATDENLLAQTSNETTTSSSGSNWTAPGPFSIEDLRTGGDQISTSGSAGPPPSTRLIGQGGMMLKKLPVNPAQTSYTSIEQNERIETNHLLAYTSAFGDATGEYEMVVVYYQPQTTRVNGTQQTYAANQTVQRMSFTAEQGYSAAKLELRPHYDETWHATAWLEKDGQRVEGARWRFKHQTNPLTASPAYPTNSKGDLWRWGALNLIFPAIGGILFSGLSARHVLSRTVVGSLKGISYWAVVVAVVIGIAALVGTWQTSKVLANAPIVVGLLMGLLALPVMLSIRDSDLSKAGFFRRALRRDAISPSGDQTVGTRKVENKIKKVYRHGEDLYAPVAGLRPMLARYWADPASIPTEDWESYDTGDGDLDQLFEVDPEADEVLTHRPARLAFSPDLTVEVDEDELADPPEKEGIAALPEAMSAVVSNTAKRLNWRFIGIAVVGGIIAYQATMLVVDTHLLALGMATLPALAEGYEARDGDLRVEWGPSHWNDVQAQVQTEREEYEERRTFDDVLQAVTDLEWSEHEKGQQVVERVRSEIAKALDEEHGGNQSTPATPSDSSPQTGVGDD